MRYRTDIDGLRAVAVLPVVAFHYGLERVAPGGFVGVDIFFVISGFLITRIIHDDMAAGRYSITEFYERRVRRIFPALFVMFASCLAAAFLFYFPTEIADIGASIAASVFFVSNIYFAHIGSYFDGNLQATPVLHTWSLSVEEQFYVLFPLLLLLIRYLAPRYVNRALIGVVLLSFAVSAVQVFVAPTPAFYMTYSRAWELLLGGLAAVGAYPAVTSRRVAEAITLAGLAAIAASLMLYNVATPFPGLAALLPCLGSLAILHVGTQQRTLVSRALSLPPVRFIGLISYSLYLWHWPIFVFYTSFYFPDRATKVALIVLAIAISAASWWFVERPFRGHASRVGRRKVLGAASAAMLATACAALIMAPLDLRFWPVSPAVAASVEYEHYRAEQPMRVGTCFLTSEFNSLDWFQAGQCLRIDPGRRNVLIVGDSHAAHLWAGFETAYPGINFLQATASGCKPVEVPTGASRCTELMNYVFDTYLPGKRLDTIIISARWAGSDVAGAIATAAKLRRYAQQVIISGPIEEYDQAPPRLLARAEAEKKDVRSLAARHLRLEPQETDRLFAAAQLPEGVQYVSVYHTLCTPECPLSVGDGVPLQFDYYGHLTKAGAVYVARRIGPLFLGPTPTQISARSEK